MCDDNGDLTFHEYDHRAEATAIYPGRGSMAGLTYVALGLAGEAGEFADHVKKVLRDDGGVMSEEKRRVLQKEAGDVLWYLSRAADELKLDLEGVAFENLTKLADRQARGALGGYGDNR